MQYEKVTATHPNLPAALSSVPGTLPRYPASLGQINKQPLKKSLEIGVCLDACARQTLEFGILLAFPADFSQQAVSISHRWKFSFPISFPPVFNHHFPVSCFKYLDSSLGDG